MAERRVMTVGGPVAPAEIGVADGHNHLWLTPVAGAASGYVLDDLAAIADELRDYRRAGGRTQIDCQPGGCGRDGRKLRQLANLTDVHIVACTGYHLRKYYPPDFWLWTADAQTVYDYFYRELTASLDETRGADDPVRAGFIKIAFEEDVKATPAPLLDAAASAARAAGVAIEIHTERGIGAEAIVRLLADRGVGHDQLILCHLDKRPEVELHRALCQQGVTLEYDTFLRPKYQPDQTVWPLLEKLVAAGCEKQIVLATDQADPAMWQHLGSGPGLIAFITQVMARMQSLGFSPETINRLAGGNIADRLATQF